MTSTPTIAITLIEDNPAYRESIRLVLERESDLQLFREYGTAEQALRDAAWQSSLGGNALLLLDLQLPGMGGLEALPWIRNIQSDLPVIVLTQSDQEHDVVSAIASGASGYLLKNASPRQITEAIRLVHAGGASLDPQVAAFILTQVKGPDMDSGAGVKLSERELETLQFLSEGLLKKEIADRLGVTQHTVATYTKRIYEKLAVPNAPAAVNKAYQLGIFGTKFPKK